MFSNNLNGIYEYESERRNDERRAAAESQILRGLNGSCSFSLPSPYAVIVLLALLAAILKTV
jgi:hypothetical protein